MEFSTAHIFDLQSQYIDTWKGSYSFLEIRGSNLCEQTDIFTHLDMSIHVQKSITTHGKVDDDDDP